MTGFEGQESEEARAERPDRREFSRLTILRDLGLRTCPGRKRRRRYVECLCLCGRRIQVRLDALRSGNTESCGCLHKERAALAARFVHGQHGNDGTQLFRTWYGMVSRCERPSHGAYPNYGGRGIKVCEGWRRDYRAFAAWARSHGYRVGLTIERKDNDGDYEPSNCMWIAPPLQARNTRRSRFVEAFGERKLLADWCEDPRCVVYASTLWHRLRLGWPAELAITAEPHEYRWNALIKAPEPTRRRAPPD